VVVEHHHPFEAGKFHHLNLLEHWRTIYGKMAEANRNPEVFLLDHVKHQLVDFVKIVTELLNEELNFEFVQGYQVHSVEKTLDSSQLFLQPIPFKFSELNLLQKVASLEVLRLKDVFVQPFVFPCNQISSDNPRTEVIVVAAEFVAEDVAVVVAIAHCHVFWVDDETLDPENLFHGQSQYFRQLAMFVKVQKAETEHLETQRDELPSMK
jgi:hypothetical protein